MGSSVLCDGRVAFNCIIWEEVNYKNWMRHRLAGRNFEMVIHGPVVASLAKGGIGHTGRMRQVHKPMAACKQISRRLPNRRTDGGRCMQKMVIPPRTTLHSAPATLSKNLKFECPLYPQKRTLIERVGMSALCQKRTFSLIRLSGQHASGTIRGSSGPTPWRS